MDDMAFSPPAGQSIETLKLKGVEDDTRGKKQARCLENLENKKRGTQLPLFSFNISDKTTIAEEEKKCK